MGLSPEQIEARRGGIGASDVGVILGLNPWKSPADLWADKVLGAKMPGSRSTKRGTREEPRVLEDYTDYTGSALVSDPQYTRYFNHPSGHVVRFTASCDAVVAHPANSDPEVCVEAKTAYSMDSWGTPGTDEIPHTYLLQVFTQMWCSGAKRADVAVKSGFDFFVYVVNRPEETLLDEIVTKCADWWVEHVVGKKCPDGPPPRVEVMASVEREPESAVELDEECDKIIEDWLLLKKRRNELGTQEKALRADLIRRLGDAEVGVGRTGYLTYSQNKAGARKLEWVGGTWRAGRARNS